MREFRIYNLLRPFGWLYGLVTGIRNRLYDNGTLKSVSFTVPVISIGNITVGGTGKTPHTEYLAGLLKDKYRIAILSRGYGRHTKGFMLSDGLSDSGMIGDEPLQIKNRFPDIDVAVSEDRIIGIRKLMQLCSPRIIILDDAFQHRKVRPSLNILLVNYSRNILDDAMLPAGRLRESTKGRKRADIIIVSKCPAGITEKEMNELEAKLPIKPGQQLYFTSLDYGELYPIDGKAAHPAQNCPVLAVTGIADPAPMEAELRRSHTDVRLLSYPDHHEFSRRDIQEMKDLLQNMPSGSIIVTTAKDAARLSSMKIDDNLLEKIFVLPVKPAFIRNQDRFRDTILTHIETYNAQ